MFYDRDDPVGFACDAAACLGSEGVGHLEQSCVPLTLERVSCDTVCHEHFKCDSLRNIVEILRRAERRVFSVCFNSIDGCGFSVAAAHPGWAENKDTGLIGWMLDQEAGMGLDTTVPFRDSVSMCFGINGISPRSSLCWATPVIWSTVTSLQRGVRCCPSAATSVSTCCPK